MRVTNRWYLFPILKILAAALPVLLGVLPATVNAQQPFKTNDAATVEKGFWQVQFLNSFDRMDESLTPLSKQNWANRSLGFGISPKMEVGIAIPYLAVGGTAWEHGIGDMEVNAKVQIAPARPGRQRPGVSIATKVEFPTGDSERSLGSGFVDWETTLVSNRPSWA